MRDTENYRTAKNYAFLILGLLFFFNILAWLVVYQLKGVHFLQVNFFNVGQGDSIFITTPQRHQILIDGGPSSIILEKLGREMPFWDRTIDLIILTHPHNDHLKGLIDVLKKYRIEKILWTGVFYDSLLFKEWQKTITKSGAQIYIAQAGQKIIGGETVFEILYPFEYFKEKEVDNLDDLSIAAKLIFKENSFLFTGDAPKETELVLVNKLGKILKSDVLKVAHHGSNKSNAEEFIKKVLPTIAVISVGKNNRYGHPHQEVLDILERYGINILRTDRDGDIKIISNGKNLIIKK